MTAAPRQPLSISYRLAVVLILIAGATVSALSYKGMRTAEEERMQGDFRQRAILRHTLIREVMSRYEDSLFGWSSIFLLNEPVSQREFVAVTRRLEERIKGAQAFEWVPVVPHARRANFEAQMARDLGLPFEITELDGAGRRRRAAERADYLPITFLHPVRGNEAALGYDLRTGPTQALLERARQSRSMVVSHQVRLIQETATQRGVIMLWPIFRGREGGLGEETLAGYVQCVFRVHDMLETARSHEPSTTMDMLFVDAGESDPERRMLYFRPADDRAPRGGGISENEFRRGVHVEHPLRFGGRDWKVIYRPQEEWVASQFAVTPVLRSVALLLMSGLLAGLVWQIARRTDTIERQVAERTEELVESRRQFASMLHALPGMAYRCTYDEELTILFVSDGATELTGWSPEEFMTGKVHFRDCIHPDDLTRVREVTRSALQERSEVEVEYRLRTKAGGNKWVLSRGRGLYSEAGALEVFEGLAIDITAQRQAESARLALERKLLEGQKLESLGLLAGGIAHDFNNLLSSILGNANLARLSLPPSTPVDPQLRAIETASLRAAELCRQMLAYAGKGQFVIEPTDLTVLTEELLPLLRISVAHHAELKLELARNLPAVMADATQLRQIVMNLVLNAADAIGDRGGEITLTTGIVHADHALLASCVAGAGLPGGQYLFIEVKDTGCGMAPDVIAKIFDPFFTTKFAGRGLGLAAVLGIVRGHKGALSVTSRPGEGSTFRLLLPPAPAMAWAPKPIDIVPGQRWQHSGTVLVIEDEEPVRTMIVQVLKSFGVSALEAADGKAGVEIFRSDPARVDIVLLDLLMPGLSGEQTLAALRVINPDVRVLLVSGFSEGDVIGRLGAAGGRLAFLAKPFARDALERKLRELLAIT